MKEKRYWVWLSMIFGSNTRKLWQLFNLFESVEELCFELISEASDLGLTENETKNIRSYSLKSAEALISEAWKKGIGAVGYSEPDYPAQLKMISDPPPVLYYKGDMSCLNGTKTITSVGTRSASEYSISACRRICGELSEKGFVIISGFAVGIDITSHMAAASQGRPTACVLGCGIDIDYPKENFKYRDPIIESGGVFISEYPPGMKANRGSFPRRNRILAALGRATVVFEGALKSGSLLTANNAADQGREVFVLPPADIFSDNFGGNIHLLKEGAVPLMGTEDITDFFRLGSEADAYIKADAFAYVVRNSSSQNRRSPSVRNIADILRNRSSENNTVEKNISEKHENKKEDKAENVVEKAVENYDLDSIPEGLQRDIMALLVKEGKLHADVISTKLGADQTEILNELTELEMFDYVKQHPGRFFEAI